MTQLHLPLFPAGATEITSSLSFVRNEETVTYFHSGMPVFSHAQDDRASFRLIMAQLHVTCGAKQADLARAFGVPQITIKRAVKQYRQNGAKGFYAPRATRGASVLTTEVLNKAQGHLDEGMPPRKVAELLGIKPDTLSKAIQAGRLHKVVKKTMPHARIRAALLNRRKTAQVRAAAKANAQA
jgi:hypothetical protein